jgi:aminoglycoside 2'-N-acetyltransferase I
MTELVVRHTGQLDHAVLGAARDLLDDVFSGEFTDHDWDHTLGRMHALMWSGDELVGHAALIQRGLMQGAGRCGRDTSRASPFGPTSAGAATAMR